MTPSRSSSAFDEALDFFPGGVNSPVRSFKAVGGTPVFFDRGHGAVLRDREGRQYLDFVQGWGAHILGHTPPSVTRALRRQAGLMTSVGAPTEHETRLAREIRSAFPAMERMRFVNSGTEAVMSAVRVARAATARPLILKFDGCYHGHSDGLLVQAGSGLASVGQPSSAGVDPRQASGTISVPYNDLAAVQAAFEAKPEKIAAVLVEPIAANMGLVPPRPGYLSGLRRMCNQNGALLIFDEVITGFRLTWGGAQTLFGVTPDLTTLGKIIGGGLSAGAYGGRRDLMSLVAPDGPVYQAGTLAGNPLAMEAGLAVLKKLQANRFYDRLEARTSRWSEGMRRLLTPGRQTLHAQGGLFTLFFSGGPIHDFSMALESDQDLYARFFHGLLAKGVYFPPSQFESGFVGASHSRSQLDKALKAVEEVLTDLHC
ncbi:MAG TPA: glutamate-1-semialdehyde 2,1-aminomutase [Spirochaetia bacterium]|nr:glutamate-1-semialdehyde 2,1-aminomutase [Spirochaetia bacterium]